jgi:hypothetical protein
MPPVTMEPLKVGTVPEVYTMPLEVHAPLAVPFVSFLAPTFKLKHEDIHSKGPCVPRYVTTGCEADFGVGFATATLAAARKEVSIHVKETMMAVWIAE